MDSCSGVELIPARKLAGSPRIILKAKKHNTETENIVTMEMMILLSIKINAYLSCKWKQNLPCIKDNLKLRKINHRGKPLNNKYPVYKHLPHLLI